MNKNYEVSAACEVLSNRIDNFLVDLQFGKIEVKSTLLNEFGVEMKNFQIVYMSDNNTCEVQSIPAIDSKHAISQFSGNIQDIMQVIEM